jgi:hypothetical protein
MTKRAKPKTIWVRVSAEFEISADTEPVVLATAPGAIARFLWSQFPGDAKHIHVERVPARQR